MPHYFFDVYDGTDMRDDEGVVYSDDIVARTEAIRAAGSMLRDHATLANGATWQMIVRDERGAVVASLTFTAS